MCMVEYAENDWELASCREVKAARKEHRCDDCGRRIHVGESYTYMTGLYEGQFTSLATCRHCRAAAAWLDVACNGFLYGAIRDDLEEHWHESPAYQSPTLRALLDGIAARWHDGSDPLPDADEVRASVPVVAHA